MRNLIKKILKYPMILLNKIFLYFYYEFSSKRFFSRDKMFEKSEQNILILSPHVDDETIALGSTIIKHKRNKDKIYCLYMTDGSGASSHLSKEELIEERKVEARRLQKKAGIDHIGFLDIPDGQVDLNDEIILKLSQVIEEVKPDIIYTPFLLDGHPDHVNTTRLLISSLNGYFNNIYMYEVNTRLSPKYINSISIVNKRDFINKDELYEVFESQYVMGFDAFKAVDRAKRLLADGSYAVESFVNVNSEELKSIDRYLIEKDFNPTDFRQLSSRYNLILSYLKNKKLKDEYMSEIGKKYI